MPRVRRGRVTAVGIALLAMGCVRTAEPVGPCDYVMEDHVVPFLGPTLTVVEDISAIRQECLVFEGDVDPARLTTYSFSSYNHLTLRLLPPDEWQRRKSPNPSLDQPLDGLGDEAYLLMTGGCGNIVALRRGDLGFVLAGCILRGEDTPNEPVVTWARELAGCLSDPFCLERNRTVRHLAIAAPRVEVPPKEDLDLFSDEFDAVNRRGVARSDLLEWMGARGCCLINEKDGNPLAARCPQPAGSEIRGMRIELRFDEDDRLHTSSIETDYRGTDRRLDPCQPGFYAPR